MKKNIGYYTMYMVLAVVLVIAMPDMNVKALELWLIAFLNEPQTLTYTVYFISMVTVILIFVKLKKAKKNEK